MRRKSVIWTSIGVTVILLGALFLWGTYLATMRQNVYGQTPAIGAAWIEADPTGTRWCAEVDAITPAAHYNLFGRFWQDEHILWEDVEVRTREGILDPGFEGPMKLGDRVCSWPRDSFIRFTYLPTGQRLWSFNTAD